MKYLPEPTPVTDTEILDWLEAHYYYVRHVGDSIYVRTGYGQPYIKCESIRHAVRALKYAEQHKIPLRDAVKKTLLVKASVPSVPAVSQEELATDLMHKL